MRKNPKAILEKIIKSFPNMPMPPEPPEQPDPAVVNRRVRKHPPVLPNAYCPAYLPATGKKWRWRKKSS